MALYSSMYQTPNQFGYNGYNNINSGMYNQQPQINYQPSNYGVNYNPQQQQIQFQGMNGKVVESIDIVKTVEIPLGGWAIFPQADGKFVYIKRYLNDGSTQILTYSPIEEKQAEQKNDSYSDALIDIQKKIEEIDSKVTSLIS